MSYSVPERATNTPRKLGVTSYSTESSFSQHEYIDENRASTIRTISRRNQAVLVLIFLPIGALILVMCICAIVWLAVHGPILVPGQDTRISAFIISFSSRLAWLIISAALIRSAWASFLQHILRGEQIPIRALVGVCRGFLSLDQLGEFFCLPVSFKCHILIAALISLAMTATSASVRYQTLGPITETAALVADVESMCQPSGGVRDFSCLGGTLNANTTSDSWSYLEEVNSGGQGTVYRYGELGIDQELGANVTLAVIPPGWTLTNANDLPWMAISVNCTPLSISASIIGSGASTNVSIFVNGERIDTLDVANMPEWGAIVHLYQQANDNGQDSSLSPWIVVGLSRDLGDGGSNFGGLAPDATTFLGNSYLDLHGYGPVLQGVLGAATLCKFTAATGGTWQDLTWQSLNDTSNIFFGPVTQDDRPTTATAMLNFGPSWQYNPVSENSLPGGSVTYIANNTGPDVTFPQLFASYIRNQWTLVAYSIPRVSGYQVPLSFFGTAPEKLYISLTVISVLPASALFIGLLITLRAWVYAIRHRHWVNRVEFESWWLVKALRPDMYAHGYSNATLNDFNAACEGVSTAYMDIRPSIAFGQLALRSTNPYGVTAQEGFSVLRDPQRIYG
jgi:hypothetical protein